MFPGNVRLSCVVRVTPLECGCRFAPRQAPRRSYSPDQGAVVPKTHLSGIRVASLGKQMVIVDNATYHGGDVTRYARSHFPGDAAVATL